LIKLHPKLVNSMAIFKFNPQIKVDTYAKITQLMFTASIQQILMRVATHNVDATTLLLDAVEQWAVTCDPATAHVTLRHRRLITN
jgi:hypothetical protein